MIDDLISRLDRVKRTGPSRYVACCPAHADRHPSMTVRECDDGRVLVKCFAGCSVEQILSAVGLEFEALFPPRSEDHRFAPLKSRISSSDALRVISGEALFVAYCSLFMSRGNSLGDGDRERLLKAHGRIQSAVEESGIEL